MPIDSPPKGSEKSSDQPAARHNRVRAFDRLSAPRRGLRREEAAEFFALSLTKFEELVRDDRLPRPFWIDGCKIWDLEKLNAAFDRLSDEGPNEWD